MLQSKAAVRRPSQEGKSEETAGGAGKAGGRAASPPPQEHVSPKKDFPQTGEAKPAETRATSAKTTREFLDSIPKAPHPLEDLKTAYNELKSIVQGKTLSEKISAEDFNKYKPYEKYFLKERKITKATTYHGLAVLRDDIQTQKKQRELETVARRKSAGRGAVVGEGAK